jgi:hypothetical protein
VKEKRKGPISRAAGLAEGVAATMRRLQRERGPRILVYDETGYARLVQPNGRGYERLLETAEQMVALVSQAEAEAKPRLVRRTEGTEKPSRADAKSRRAESEPDRAEPRSRRSEAKSRRAESGGAEPRSRRSEAKSRRAEAKSGRAGAKPGSAESAGGDGPKPGRAGSKPRRADSKKPRRSPKRSPEDGS